MDTAQPISVFLPPLLYGIGHGTPCPYKNKKHRAGTKIIPYHCPEKADPTERSWRGVLRGHVPSKSLSADSEIPCAHTSGHTEKVGEKSDSFSRAERTRPLRPVSRLNGRNLENIPVECFQRDFPLLQNHRTRHAVSLQSQSARNTSPAALSWSSLIGQLDEMHSVFRTTTIFFCAAKKLRHFPNLFGSWRSFFIFPQLSRSGTALRSYFFFRPFFRLVATATANAASAVGTRTTANASLVFGVLLMFCAR